VHVSDRPRVCVLVHGRVKMANGVLLIHRRGLVFSLAVAVLFFASAAKADTVKLTGTVGSITLTVSDPDAAPPYTNAAALIDPYKGTLGPNSVLLWCVDPDHMDKIGDIWTVNVSQLGGDLSKTYLGNANATTYGEMAWLITQLQAASIKSTKQELQAAIWLLAEGVPGEDGKFKVTAPTGDPNFWTNVNIDMTNASLNVEHSGFEILTDVAGQKQEFMVITPEPSTLLLLGIGLIALFVFTPRKACSAASRI
jgi:PEP-CTERM motif